MTTDDVLEVVRQGIGQAIEEIGCNTPTYPDDFLIRYVWKANLSLTVLGIVTNVTVDKTAVTITPDASTAIGMLLATFAAVSIIRDDILKRLRGGELGLSFTSGATSISTNQAAQYLKGAADSLENFAKLLMTSYLSGDPNTVDQRVESSNTDPSDPDNIGPGNTQNP